MLVRNAGISWLPTSFRVKRWPAKAGAHAALYYLRDGALC